MIYEIRKIVRVFLFCKEITIKIPIDLWTFHTYSTYLPWIGLLSNYICQMRGCTARSAIPLNATKNEYFCKCIVIIIKFRQRIQWAYALRCHYAILVGITNKEKLIIEKFCLAFVLRAVFCSWSLTNSNRGTEPIVSLRPALFKFLSFTLGELHSLAGPKLWFYLLNKYLCIHLEHWSFVQASTSFTTSSCRLRHAKADMKCKFFSLLTA